MHRYVYYPKNLLPSIVLNLVFQVASSGIFVQLEAAYRTGSQLDVEALDYANAFYHCIVTATTVGYGEAAHEDGLTHNAGH